MPYPVTVQKQSENDVDITGALFNDNDDDSDASEDRVGGGPTSGSRSLQHGDLEVGDGLALDDAADGYDSDDKDFITAIQAASNRKASTLKGRTVKKGGGFQAMGLNGNLLKAIARKGFTVPTPIQRKTIPLVLDGQDVVGMARTGSGKTAAFVVPLIEKLKVHSAKVGARSLILSPSRELALQTLKVVKELGRGTDLKCVLLVGGDSLEEQFGFMATNPDILIATPGRFLHLQVEMSLDLFSISYVVFDEADRLFEMGFAAQLREILHALPSSRQTLLFSATLPKSLVEFARAGLQDPRLVRLDTESKISPDLQSAYFTVKTEEKEGALLHVLFDVIKMPMGVPAGAQAKATGDVKVKKRKRGAETPSASESPTEHSTIVFTATKHHVEYLASLLRAAGFAVSHAYGSLDQTARKMQVQDFRSGITNILVVTDVAARGIDIPILANVINYDFPAQPKIFVHRVGRTARAGKQGWSYSFVRDADAPYLLDLQLFLGKSLILGSTAGSNVDFSKDVTVGSLGRDRVETSCEWVKKILEEDVDLAALRSVAAKGEKLYLRTRNSASSESAKRAKDITASNAWLQLHPLFNADTDGAETARTDMLARISGFRPLETVFEIGKRGGNSSEAAEIIRERRKGVLTRKAKRIETKTIESTTSPENSSTHITDTKRDYSAAAADDTYDAANMDSASDEELEVTFSQSNTRDRGLAQDYWKDSEHFMSYAPTSTNAAEDRGYGVHSGSYNTARQNSNFVEAARGAVMDLNNDEGAGSFGEPSRARGLRWDKQQKKYVSRANDEDGSKGTRMIKGESGQKIAASFRSGRFDAWRKSNKINRMQRIGELEKPSSHLGLGGSGRIFKHRGEKAPKEADRFRDDYHVRKKRVEEAKANRVGKFAETKSKKELRGVDDVRKQRNVKAKRKDKNARPSKRRKA